MFCLVFQSPNKFFFYKIHTILTSSALGTRLIHHYFLFTTHNPITGTYLVGCNKKNSINFSFLLHFEISIDCLLFRSSLFQVLSGIVGAGMQPRSDWTIWIVSIKAKIKKKRYRFNVLIVYKPSINRQKVLILNLLFWRFSLCFPYGLHIDGRTYTFIRAIFFINSSKTRTTFSWLTGAECDGGGCCWVGIWYCCCDWCDWLWAIGCGCCVGVCDRTGLGSVRLDKLFDKFCNCCCCWYPQAPLWALWAGDGGGCYLYGENGRKMKI